MAGSLSSFVAVQHSVALYSRTTKPGGDCDTSVFQRLAINRADSHHLGYCIAEYFLLNFLMF